MKSNNRSLKVKFNNLYRMSMKSSFNKKILSLIDWFIVRFSSIYRTSILSCKLSNRERPNWSANSTNKWCKTKHHNNKDKIWWWRCRWTPSLTIYTANSSNNTKRYNNSQYATKFLQDTTSWTLRHPSSRLNSKDTKDLRVNCQIVVQVMRYCYRCQCKYRLKLRK